MRTTLLEVVEDLLTRVAELEQRANTKRRNGR
jgi:hypothetical protein